MTALATDGANQICLPEPCCGACGVTNADQVLYRFNPKGLKAAWLCTACRSQANNLPSDLQTAIYDAPTVILHDGLLAYRTDPAERAWRVRQRKERMILGAELRRLGANP